jgi:hypothetical protein
MGRGALEMPKGDASNGKRKSSAAHLPVLVDTELVTALGHALRQHILLAAVAGEVSPNGLSKALNVGLSSVAYHARVLHGVGLLELTRTEQRRGATEHFYRATAKTLLPAKRWRGLAGLGAVVGAGQASDLFDDLAGALEAGRLQGAHDDIVRIPLVLDADGARKVTEIAKRAIEEVEDQQRAAAERIERANGDGGGGAVRYIFALLAFEAAWEPAPSPYPHQ